MSKRVLYSPERPSQKEIEAFMQSINPKPSKEERERLKQEYLKAREVQKEIVNVG